MAKNQVAHPRSDETWLDIITRCRQSGLTDKQWCIENDVSPHSFYTAVRRLRKKSYALPEHEKKPCLDLRSTQDVVQIGILPDPERTYEPALPGPTSHPAIEIELKGIDIRIFNNVDPALLAHTLHALREGLC